MLNLIINGKIITKARLSQPRVSHFLVLTEMYCFFLQFGHSFPVVEKPTVHTSPKLHSLLQFEHLVNVLPPFCLNINLLCSCYWLFSLFTLASSNVTIRAQNIKPTLVNVISNLRTRFVCKIRDKEHSGKPIPSNVKAF